MLSNSLFLDDKAILNLYGILASGEELFFIALLNTEILPFKCTLKQLGNGNFQVEFDIPQNVDDFNIEDFYAKPAVLTIPKPPHKRDLPDFNIIINPTDVEDISAKYNSDEKIPIHVIVTIRGFKTYFEDKDRTVAKHTVLFKYNPKLFSPANKGILYYLTTNKNQDSSFKNATSIELQNQMYLFYFEEVSEDCGYFVIKSQNDVPYSNFTKLVESIRSAYALINGYYIADTVLYISKKSNSNSRFALEYKCINSTVNSQRPLLDYNLYSNVQKEDLLLAHETFENLVKLLYNSEELRRSCILITQSACLDNISNGSLASVAIETITGYFIENSTVPKPKLFDNVEIIRHIKHELDKVVKDAKKFASNIGVNIDKSSWEKLKSKLGKFNEMPNALKLSTPFEESGIILSTEEQLCINCRNLYLHGKTPKSKISSLTWLSDNETYIYISNTLRMLAGMLLLKKAGFNGHIIDWGKTIIMYEREKINGHGIKYLTWLHRPIIEDEKVD